MEPTTTTTTSTTTIKTKKTTAGKPKTVENVHQPKSGSNKNSTTTTTTNSNANANSKRRRKRKGGVPPPFHLVQQHSKQQQLQKKKNETSSTAVDVNVNDDNVDADVNDVLEGVANLLLGKKNIVVLLGAGISTSVGIPDFRSKDKGLYNTLDAEALGLSCPEDLFCIEFFNDDPSPFYKFATHLYYPNKKENKNNGDSNSNASGGSSTNNKTRKGRKQLKGSATPTSTATATATIPPARKSSRIQRKGQDQQQQEPSITAGDGDGANESENNNKSNGMAQPSDSHKLLALLEKNKMLLRVYTQNIDGLESSAGVSDSKIVYCHGSLKSMSCTKCSKKKLPLDHEMLASIKSGTVPHCRAAVKVKPKGGSSLKQQKLKQQQQQQASPNDVSDAQHTGMHAASNQGTCARISSTTTIRSPTRTSSRRKKRPRSTINGDEEDCDHQKNNEIDDDDEKKNSSNNNNSFGNVCGGVLKPGITFFGETLDHSVGRRIESDQHKADALIVIGTSLSVAPISKVIEYLPRAIPRILINRTIVHPQKTTAATTTIRPISSRDKDDDNDDTDFRTNYVFDAYLLGFCDDVTRALGKQLGLGFDIGEDETNSVDDGDSTTTKAKGKAEKKKAKSNATSTERKQQQQQQKRNAKTGTAVLAQNNKHASATAAKLLTSVMSNKVKSSLPSATLSSSPSCTTTTSNNDNEWSTVTVPRERVILFPGALPAASSSNNNTKDKNNNNSQDTNLVDEVYHEIAHCDGCSQQIPQGRPIFKCCKCFDFDLCQRCYPKVSKLHCNGKHTFRRE